jgi:serine/threonine-protein kinase
MGGGELVAVKRIHAHLATNPKFVEMFLHEAQTAARIRHANVVGTTQVGHVGDEHFMVMEYVPGWDLGTIIKLMTLLHRPMPPLVAFRIVADLCAGLSAAHDFVNEEGTPLPIVHRDVSPANILVSVQGTIKLTDFGIAKAADTLVHTDSGVVKGKTAYLAPERFQAAHTIDVRQDLFSAGVIMHECLAGTLLFQRDSQVSTMRAILEDPIPRIADLRGDVEPEVDAILARALARKVSERYASASELANDLEVELLRSTVPPDLAGWLDDLVTAGVAAGIMVTDAEGEPPRMQKPSSIDTDVEHRPA